MSVVLNTKHLSGFINEEEYKAIYPQVEAAHRQLEAKNGPGNDFLGWMYLPRDYDKEEFARIKAAAAKIREDSDVLVVAGIGGSYLGARAVVEAVKGMYHNELEEGLKIYFCGNSISPTYLNNIISLCKGKRFSINVFFNDTATTETAQFLRDILSGSAIMDESRSLRVQDSMNTRIIPHVHGIAKRMAGQTYDALMEELYSVFDNPIFLPDGTALMGSNWDATAIELYCDSLAIAVMDVAKLTEVHMERLVDPHLSGLPAFLVKNPGLNNGFMIPQYVTAGLLGDIALLCAPAAAFNAAVSAGQESPVYRDDTAARQLYQAVQKLRSLVSMTMLTALQAIDLSDHKAMSPVTQKVHDHARQTVTFMENDDLMYQRIEAMEHLVESNQLLADCPVPFTI